MLSAGRRRLEMLLPQNTWDKKRVKFGGKLRFSGHWFSLLLLFAWLDSTSLLSTQSWWQSTWPGETWWPGNRWNIFTGSMMKSCMKAVNVASTSPIPLSLLNDNLKLSFFEIFLLSTLSHDPFAIVEKYLPSSPRSALRLNNSLSGQIDTNTLSHVSLSYQQENRFSSTLQQEAERKLDITTGQRARWC